MNTTKKTISTQDDMFTSIEERIKYLRQNRKMSRERLAALMLLSPETIKKMEQGLRGIDLQKVRDLQGIFNVSYEFIIDGEKHQDSKDKILKIFNELSYEEKKEILVSIVQSL